VVLQAVVVDFLVDPQADLQVGLRVNLRRQQQQRWELFQNLISVRRYLC
jgi:hypothetical protein